ncbi:MAG: hypothetical protein AAGF45_01230 [Pseudomonadota bacterium]
MSEKNLVPVPEPDERRAAMRRARMERRRAMAQRNTSQPATAEADSGPVARATPAAVPLRAEAFAMPPRAQVDRSGSKFGQFIRTMFALFVLAPTVICMLFYGFVASDQYATHSAFAVRGASSSSSAIDLGSIFSMGGTATDSETADSYILQEFIHSREMVEYLVAEANFLEIYSRGSADPYYRLDPESSIEGLVSYWQMMSSVEFDTDTGIISLIVRAFRPSDAEAITRKVIERSEALINELSQRAREDSLRTAREEVGIAENRFAETRKALAAYRGSEREIDPTATARSRQSVVAALDGQLAEREAELRALRSTMSENAPRVVYVRNQIDALERQIATERLSVAVQDGSDQPVLTERLSRFEELTAEREFAERAYVSTLTSLELARVEALKQQRYLAVFVRGSAPEASTYPEGIRWTLIVFGSLFIAWGVVALIGAAIRDRVA